MYADVRVDLCTRLSPAPDLEHRVPDRMTKPFDELTVISPAKCGQLLTVSFMMDQSQAYITDIFLRFYRFFRFFSRTKRTARGKMGRFQPNPVRLQRLNPRRGVGGVSSERRKEGRKEGERVQAAFENGGEFGGLGGFLGGVLGGGGGCLRVGAEQI